MPSIVTCHHQRARKPRTKFVDRDLRDLRHRKYSERAQFVFADLAGAEKRSRGEREPDESLAKEEESSGGVVVKVENHTDQQQQQQQLCYANAEEERGDGGGVPGAGQTEMENGVLVESAVESVVVSPAEQQDNSDLVLYGFRPIHYPTIHHHLVHGRYVFESRFWGKDTGSGHFSFGWIQANSFKFVRF